MNSPHYLRPVHPYILAPLIFLGVSACNPRTFELQRPTGWTIEGRILGDYHFVDVKAENLFTVEHPAAVAMRCEPITDGVFDTEMTWIKPGDVLMVMRSTPYEDSTSTPQPISIRIGASETVVTYGSTVIRANTPTPVDGTPFRVYMVQHGRTIDITVGCTKVCHLNVDRPSTQWITIRPEIGTAVEFRDPKFLPLTEEFSRVSYP